MKRSTELQYDGQLGYAPDRPPSATLSHRRLQPLLSAHRLAQIQTRRLRGCRHRIER